MTFKAIMCQDMSFFDEDVHSKEKLCSALSTDAVNILGVSSKQWLVGFCTSDYQSLNSFVQHSIAYDAV